MRFLTWRSGVCPCELRGLTETKVSRRARRLSCRVRDAAAFVARGGEACCPRNSCRFQGARLGGRLSHAMGRASRTTQMPRAYTDRGDAAEGGGGDRCPVVRFCVGQPCRSAGRNVGRFSGSVLVPRSPPEASPTLVFLEGACCIMVISVPRGLSSEGPI